MENTKSTREIYYSLISRGLFPEDLKGCCNEPEEQESYFTLINTSSRRAKRDGKISLWYGLTTKRRMVSQSWIIDYVEMYTISGEVIKVIENTLENWRVELTAEGKSLAEVKTQRGIFQGDALSLLLFVIAMMPLCYRLRKCKFHKS